MNLAFVISPDKESFGQLFSKVSVGAYNFWEWLSSATITGWAIVDKGSLTDEGDPVYYSCNVGDWYKYSNSDYGSSSGGANCPIADEGGNVMNISCSAINADCLVVARDTGLGEHNIHFVISASSSDYLFVNLTYPANGASVSSPVDLNFSAWSNKNITNCSLFTNISGSFVETSNLTFDDDVVNITNFTTTVPSAGDYLWGVRCQNNESLVNFSVNRTFVIASAWTNTSPLLFFTFPSNNSQLNNSNNFWFNVSAVDNQSVFFNFSLVVDGYL